MFATATASTQTANATFAPTRRTFVAGAAALAATPLHEMKGQLA